MDLRILIWTIRAQADGVDAKRPLKTLMLLFPKLRSRVRAPFAALIPQSDSRRCGLLCVCQRPRLISSHSSDAKNDSHIALSSNRGPIPWTRRSRLLDNRFRRIPSPPYAARSADECASHSREANGRHRVRWQFEPPLVVSVGMQLERAGHHAIGLLGGVRKLRRRSGQ